MHCFFQCKTNNIGVTVEHMGEMVRFVDVTSALSGCAHVKVSRVGLSRGRMKFLPNIIYRRVHMYAINTIRNFFILDIIFISNNTRSNITKKKTLIIKSASSLSCKSNTRFNNFVIDY